MSHRTVASDGERTTTTSRKSDTPKSADSSGDQVGQNSRLSLRVNRQCITTPQADRLAGAVTGEPHRSGSDAPGGWFALSTTHPTMDWRHFEDSCFLHEWVDLMMRDGKHSIRSQRMSLETSSMRCYRPDSSSNDWSSRARSKRSATSTRPPTTISVRTRLSWLSASVARDETPLDPGMARAAQRIDPNATGMVYRHSGADTLYQ